MKIQINSDVMTSAKNTTIVAPLTLAIATFFIMSFFIVSCTQSPMPGWHPPDGGNLVDQRGQLTFLSECKTADDCASQRCVQMGPAKRCSRACTAQAQCPSMTSWDCHTTEQYCVCSPTTTATPNCSADENCDGLPDHTSQPEVCNKLDDDCNGQVDDVAPFTTGATRYFEDSDGDGFGNAQSVTWTCSKPTGNWVTNFDDCDDSEIGINPKATEICGDTVDNDCDGTKEDTDECGLTPVIVTDVNGGQLAATLQDCDTNNQIGGAFDITEIIAKQDAQFIKFVIRLAASPSTGACATYKLAFGSTKTDYSTHTYLFRLPKGSCDAAGLAALTHYENGVIKSTTADVGFNASSPGHVSFTLAKTELLPLLSSPSYWLLACTNGQANANTDLSSCLTDQCVTPVHR